MVRFIVILIALTQLCMFSGCYRLYFYRKIDFEVIDAETQEPIADAEVTAYNQYPAIGMLNQPKSFNTKSGDLGKGKIKIVTSSGTGGYLSIEKNHYFQPAEPIVSKLQNLSGTKIFKLYKDPMPTLKIVVPNHYRGLVLLDILPDEKKRQPIGKRTFIEKIDENGLVRIRSNILYDFWINTFPSWNNAKLSFEYESGKAIVHEDAPDRETKKNQILVRHIEGYHREKTIFLIGTEAEKKMFHPLLNTYFVEKDTTSTTTNTQAIEALFKNPGIINIPVSKLPKTN